MILYTFKILQLINTAIILHCHVPSIIQIFICVNLSIQSETVGEVFLII